MKKTLIRITVGTVSLVVILLATLAIHIYLVTPKKSDTANSDLRMRQLSRIDFKQTVDSTEAEKIRGFVQNLEGVQSTYFNAENGALVYTFEVGTQTSENVYSKVVAFGNYKAERYVVEAKEAQGGCPAHVKENSFSKNFGNALASLFN